MASAAAGMVAVAVWLVSAPPAVAFTPIGRLDPGDLPGGGHWRLETDAWYTPYTDTLDGSPQAKDCAPGSTDASCPPNRPVISRHWAEAGLGGEMALADDIGFDFRVPVDLVVQFAQNPAQLPPGLPPRNLVVGDLSVGLDRVFIDVPGTHVKARLAGSVAPMGAPGGNYVYQSQVKDAQGNVAKDASGNPLMTTETVFPDPPSAEFELAAAHDILDSLRLTVDASIAYPFRRSGPEPVETWNGLAFDWGAGVSWWALPDLGTSLDVVGEWTNPAEQDGAMVPTTGHDLWDLSPGVAYKPADDLTIGANILLPLFATGYQWDYVYPFLAAMSIQLEI